jgi:threonine dehydratase
VTGEGGKRAPLVTLEDIVEARRRIAGVVRPTPLDRSTTLSRFAGRPIALKPEHLQRTGSFKIRGATNFVSRLPPGTEVVAASAGNHAQGVALAAAEAGLTATIHMPRNAALPKVQATRGYGATVVMSGDTVDDAIAAGRAYAAGSGLRGPNAEPGLRGPNAESGLRGPNAANRTFVPPFDDPLVIAGQGTIGLELVEEAPDVEVVVVPVGGGGLISGIAAALALASTSAQTVTGSRPRVVGVQADGAACMRESLRAGHCVRLDHVATMADGIAVKVPSELTLAHVEAYVDEIVTVQEEDISRAVVLLLERAKAVVEPAGAAALAAILSGLVPGQGLAVAVLSGGNVDPLLLLKLIEHGLSAAGRYLILRIVLHDRPGALAALTGTIAEMGLNVLNVEHRRAGLALPVEQVEVSLTLETRDPEHRQQVVAALGQRGYQVELVAPGG